MKPEKLNMQNGNPIVAPTAPEVKTNRKVYLCETLTGFDMDEPLFPSWEDAYDAITESAELYARADIDLYERIIEFEAECGTVNPPAYHVGNSVIVWERWVMGEVETDKPPFKFVDGYTVTTWIKRECTADGKATVTVYESTMDGKEPKAIPEWTFTARKPANRFEELKRNFEREYRESKGYTLPGYDGTALWELATAIARSVLSYLKDPRKRADGDPAKRKDAVTNSGMNPAMVAMAAELFRDCGCGNAERPGDLALLRDAVNRAYAVAYTKDGNARTDVVDKCAAAAADALITERLGDGVDLAQEAAAALLELASEYAALGNDWLDETVTETRPNRKVWIQGGEKPTMETVETAPAKEAYKAVRRAVESSRAVQADPRNGYSYIEDYATADTDGLTVIYRRLGKYADLGGYDASGNYTTPVMAALDYDSIIERLSLTQRQAVIVDYRMRGYGIRAIGTKLGVSFQAVDDALKKIQRKAEKFGFTPDMWGEMTK